MNRRIVALTGHPCSGKTTAARYLAERYTLEPYNMGDYIREKAAEHGVVLPTRPVGMRFFREVMRPAYGDNVLTDPIFSGKYQEHDVVMDGIRLLHDLRRLRSEPGIDFWLIGITTPGEDRHTRYINDKERVRRDPDDYVAFLAHTATEAYNSDPMEPSIGQLLDLANVIIENTGSREDLYASLDATMSLIAGQPPSQQR